MTENSKIITTVNKIADIIEKFINVAECILIGTIAIAVVVGVIGRTGNIPVVWLGELSTYCTIWAAFLGLAIGHRNGLSARIDVITFFAPSRIAEFEIIWDLLSVIIMGIILWSCKDYIAYVARSGTQSPELNIPLYLVYMGPILGYIFTSTFCIVNILNRIYELKGGLPQHKGKEIAGC